MTMNFFIVVLKGRILKGFFWRLNLWLFLHQSVIDCDDFIAKLWNVYKTVLDEGIKQVERDIKFDAVFIAYYSFVEINVRNYEIRLYAWQK
jgi:hypothetical protein